MPRTRAILATLTAGSLAAALLVSAHAAATPTNYAAWAAAYPDSTLDTHMEMTAGFVCFVCHHPPIGADGNCYREDLKDLLHQGIPVAQAIDMLHNVDSDGDGVPNGVEFLTARAGEPGMTGYNAGLVGPTGLSPCSTEPAVPVTNASETPCLADWSRDAAVNSGDISAFLTSWLESVQMGSTSADFNFDGAVNSGDISAFLTAWLAAVQNGC
jgi:hypothetical protein